MSGRAVHGVLWMRQVILCRRRVLHDTHPALCTHAAHCCRRAARCRRCCAACSWRTWRRATCGRCCRRRRAASSGTRRRPSRQQAAAGPEVIAIVPRKCMPECPCNKPAPQHADEALQRRSRVFFVCSASHMHACRLPVHMQLAPLHARSSLTQALGVPDTCSASRGAQAARAAAAEAGSCRAQWCDLSTTSCC